MFDINQYCLLDFGQGRKLERFGPVVLDRPSPAAADASKADPKQWQMATARFIAACDALAGCGQRGRWERREALPDRWTIEHPPLAFELRPTEFGHLGVFPEQAENWDWIARQVSWLRTNSAAGNLPRVLNLFAYTGGSTLAAAAAGAEVVHIDAAQSTVLWARRNAELSGLSAAPIRWIVEDARRFVAREQKRGNRYHGVVLDPPTYGHGPKGKWQLDRDLPGLLRGCATLLADDAFLLLSSHSSGVTPPILKQWLVAALAATPRETAQAQNLNLMDAHGRLLNCGVAGTLSSATSANLPKSACG